MPGRGRQVRGAGRYINLLEGREAHGAVLIPRLKTTASQPPCDSMALIFSGSFLAGGSTTSPGMGVSGAVSTLRPYCSRTLGLGIESITVAWDSQRRCWRVLTECREWRTASDRRMASGLGEVPGPTPASSRGHELTVCRLERVELGTLEVLRPYRVKQHSPSVRVGRRKFRQAITECTEEGPGERLDSQARNHDASSPSEGSGRAGHHRGCLFISAVGQAALQSWVGDNSVVTTTVLSILGSAFLAAAIIIASRRDR